jgi:ACS family tartrate transporter-like MFS transporter
VSGVAGASDILPGLGGRLIRRLVLPLALLTFINAIDRVNVSFAGHAMGGDIGLSPTTFGFGVSAFFIAYMLFQYPHAALLRRFGMRRWLLCTVLLWGVAGVLLSRVNSVGEFLGARFLLGMAEAGFAPGVTWYINRWLPPGVRGKAMATVLSAVPLSLVVCGPLCGWMLDASNPLGVAPWRWMFLLQAAPNFVLAVAAYVYFRDSPADFRWLSPAERAVLTPSDDSQAPEPMGPALRDGRVWRCAITWLLVMTGSYALLFWLPQMVRQMPMRSGELQIGVLSALPQAALMLGMLVNGYHSDRTGERRWHVGLAAMAGGLALLAGGLSPPGWISLTLFVLAGFGIGAAQSVFWAVPAAMDVGGGRVSVAAIALISIFGTGGGVIGPTLIGWLKDLTGSFAPSLVLLSLMLIAGGLIIAPLRFHRPVPGKAAA